MMPAGHPPPDGAIDAHVHVIDPNRYAYASEGGYRPGPHETGPADALGAELKRHGLAGALLVQPSCYGTDNRAMLDVVAGDRARFRAIAVVDPEATRGELHAFSAAGVVGIRLNAVNGGPEAVTEAGPLLGHAADLGWAIELQCAARDLPALAGPVLDCGATLVLDHLGYPAPGDGLEDVGFQEVLRLAGHARVHVKLSGSFRLSREPWPHSDLGPFVSAILDTYGPERCVWGSDWPFIGVEQRPSYAETLGLLSRWLPRGEDRRTVLVETPRRLFGFPAPLP